MVTKRVKTLSRSKTKWLKFRSDFDRTTNLNSNINNEVGLNKETEDLVAVLQKAMGHNQ